MKIVFFGTPDFAVATLDALIKQGFNVVGVVTSPDKYGGRGNKQLLESAVKKYAITTGLKLLQPTNLKSQKFISDLSALKADIQVVVAFRMLPVVVWDMPPLGTYNLHGSYLPKYRGAAPINWAIINGETKTGVTTFKLKHEIDTGSIALQEEITIDPEDTAGTLHDKMMIIGANLMVKTLRFIENKSLILQEQDDSQVTKAPKIFTEDCEINLSQPVKHIYDHIRGLSPYPTSWLMINDLKIKVYWATYEMKDMVVPPHTVRTDNKNYLKIAGIDGWLYLKDIQAAGRKRMSIKEFLNGTKFTENSSIN